MEDGGEVRRGETGGGNNAGGCLHRKVEDWVCVCACVSVHAAGVWGQRMK